MPAYTSHDQSHAATANGPVSSEIGAPHKAIRLARLAACLLLAPAATVFAIPCNTGVVGNTGTCGIPLLAAGNPDSHWQLAAPFPTAPSGPLITTLPVVFGPTFANQNFNWLPNSASPVSGWIKPSSISSTDQLGGQYVYQTTFTGDDPFTGRYLSDNEVLGAFLNGVLIPAMPVPCAHCIVLNGPNDSIGNWRQISVATGLSAGSNTLDFIVRNRGTGGLDANATPTGFRGEFVVSDVPEPSSLLLLSLGLSGFAAYRTAQRRQSGTVA